MKTHSWIFSYIWMVSNVHQIFIGYSYTSKVLDIWEFWNNKKCETSNIEKDGKGRDSTSLMEERDGAFPHFVIFTQPLSLSPSSFIPSSILFFRTKSTGNLGNFEYEFMNKNKIQYHYNHHYPKSETINVKNKNLGNYYFQPQTHFICLHHLLRFCPNFPLLVQSYIHAPNQLYCVNVQCNTFNSRF